MKLLFIDIDGVLNGHDWSPEAQSNTIRPECIKALNRIIAATHCKIVLSSAWRYMIHGGAMTCTGFEYLLRTHGSIGVRIIDVTRPDRMADDCPDPPPGMVAVDPSDTRGEQITDWLKSYRGEHGPVESYAVLDDEDYDIGTKHPLVKTNGCAGMTMDDASRVVEILNRITTVGDCRPRGRGASGWPVQR
jgi:hypothetical protein